MRRTCKFTIEIESGWWSGKRLACYLRKGKYGYLIFDYTISRIATYTDVETIVPESKWLRSDGWSEYTRDEQ